MVYFSFSCVSARRIEWAAQTLRHAALLAGISALSACAAGGGFGEKPMVAAEEVRSTEMQFAKTMADRDFGAFVRYLSVDAVFFDEKAIQHGAREVGVAWQPLFLDAEAPFSWAPDHVEVLASGNLALSTGPVIANGNTVARFNSIWRLEAPHVWRIVFDKGERVCADRKD